MVSMIELIVIAHNLRSSHNIGSLLRTAEGLGVSKVYLTGYTPYPIHDGDERLPHIAQKVNAQIAKTGLGSETLVNWIHADDVFAVIETLRLAGYQVVALEQADDSVPLPEFKPTDKTVILVGREVEGIEPEIVAASDMAVEIPMFGKKESFNVVQAAAMALYHCRFSE